MPIEKILAQIEPKQDLNGYDNPWPAGGGKNKWNSDFTSSTEKFIKSDGVCEVLQPAQTVYLLGGSSQEINFELPAGTYTFSGWSDTFTGISAILQDGTEWHSGETKTFDNVLHIRQIICDNISLAVGTYYWKVQIESGSEATAWTPYENICPISGWTGLSGQRTGVNLFDKSTGIQLEPNNLRIARTQGYGVPFKLRGGVTYTFSCNSSEPRYIYLLAPYSTTAIAQSNAKVTSFTYTPAEDVEVGINFWWNTGRPSDATDFMIEVGSVAHDYAEYQGEAISVSFGQTVYGGTDEVISGQGASTMDIVDLGTLTWVYDSTNTRFYTVDLRNVIKLGESGWRDWILCSSYKSALGTNEDKVISEYASTGYIYLKDTAYTDATALKNALNGVQLVYPLATPQAFTHDGQEVDTLEGVNNVWVDIGDVSVTYQSTSGSTPVRTSFKSPLKNYSYSALKLFNNTFIEHGKG